MNAGNRDSPASEQDTSIVETLARKTGREAVSAPLGSTTLAVTESTRPRNVRAIIIDYIVSARQERGN